MSKLGSLLAAARKGKNLTLRAVERATGVSNAYLSQIENGEIQEPSPVVLSKLSKLYDIPYATALEYAGYPVPGADNTRNSLGMAARLGPFSDEEETALLEYLNFLRAKRKRERRR